MRSSAPRPDVEVSRWISQPAEKLWDFFSDVSNDAQWRWGVTAAKWTSEPPHKVGSTGVHAIQGQEDWRWTVSESEEPRSMGWDYSSGLFAGGRAGYRLDAEGAGTRVTMQLRLKPGLKQRIFIFFMRRLIVLQLMGDLAKLKAIMEA
jgi:uncharacterized membrane protein